MKCPCEECICIAMCRLKPFINMKSECSLIEEYLSIPLLIKAIRDSSFSHRIYNIYINQKPILWRHISVRKEKPSAGYAFIKKVSM